MRLNGELKVQGLLNLIDAREQDGGFMTVPGFCHHLEEFCKQDVYDKYRLGCENSYDFVYVPPKDPMHEQVRLHVGLCIAARVLLASFAAMQLYSPGAYRHSESQRVLAL